MTQVQRSVKVAIERIATAPATECAFMPLPSLDKSTMGTSDGGIGWIYQANRDAYQGSQKPHARSEVPGRMTFPSDKPLRVFQTHASTRCQCHGHQQSGFVSENLSLSWGFNLALNATFLLHCPPVALSLQNRTKVRTFVAVGSDNRSSDSHITADPFFCLWSFYRAAYRAWDGRGWAALKSLLSV